jgi:hypothetical protein
VIVAVYRFISQRRQLSSGRTSGAAPVSFYIGNNQLMFFMKLQEEKQANGREWIGSMP